jgi:TRAP-type mannitol/chloroaromatic compound transport system substrate-binding protein
MEMENARTYAQLRESGHVEMVEFPQEVLAALHDSTRMAMDEEAAKDEKFKTVRDNYEAFRREFDAWDDVTEDAYRQFFNRAGQ